MHTPTVSTTPDIVSSSLSSRHPLRIFSHSFTNSETLCEVSAWSVAFKWVTFGQMLCGCWLEAPGTVVQPFRQNWRSHPLFFFSFLPAYQIRLRSNLDDSHPNLFSKRQYLALTSLTIVCLKHFFPPALHPVLRYSFTIQSFPSWCRLLWEMDQLQLQQRTPTTWCCFTAVLVDFSLPFTAKT